MDFSSSASVFSDTLCSNKLQFHIIHKLIYIIYILFTTTGLICILNRLQYITVFTNVLLKGYDLSSSLIASCPLKQSYLVFLILSFSAVPTYMTHTTTFKTMIAVKHSFRFTTVTAIPTATWITHFYIFHLCLKCFFFYFKLYSNTFLFSSFVTPTINSSSEIPVHSKCLISWTTYVLLRPLSSVRQNTLSNKGL